MSEIERLSQGKKAFDHLNRLRPHIERYSAGDETALDDLSEADRAFVLAALQKFSELALVLGAKNRTA